MFRFRVADPAQLVDDLLARAASSFVLAAGGEQHARAGQSQVTAELQADTEAAAGDHRRLAAMQARQHTLDG